LVNSKLKIGYVPCSLNDGHPGDVRRFSGYAKYKGLEYEIASPNQTYDFVVLTQMADISVWKDYDKGKIFFDFIDSYLAVPRSNLKQLIKPIYLYLFGRFDRLYLNYWKLLGEMCEKADGVICSTLEQKKDIEKYSDNVHVILDFQEQLARLSKFNYTSGERFRIVWEGLPSNLPQLRTMKKVLHIIESKYLIELVVITDEEMPGLFKSLKSKSSLLYLDNISKSCKFVKWSKESLAVDITSCDLAVIPIDLNDPFAFGKPENKLLLFWRMGLPVVASRTPAYLRVFQAINTPELACASEVDWVHQITRLINNESERKKCANLGKDFAKYNYSTDRIMKNWDELFLSAGLKL